MRTLDAILKSFFLAIGVVATSSVIVAMLADRPTLPKTDMIANIIVEHQEAEEYRADINASAERVFSVYR